MSFQAKIIKKLLPLRLANWSHGDIAAQRARLERSVRMLRIPADISLEPVQVDGVPALQRDMIVMRPNLQSIHY